MDTALADTLRSAISDSLGAPRGGHPVAASPKWIALWAAMLCAHFCLHATARLPARIGQRFVDVLFLLTLGWAVLVPYYEVEVRGGRGSEALPVLSSLILFVVGRLASAGAGHQLKIGWLEHLIGWGFLGYFYTGVMDPTEVFFPEVLRENIRAFIGWALAALALVSLSLAVRRFQHASRAATVVFLVAASGYAIAELLLMIHQLTNVEPHNPEWMYPWFAGLKFTLTGLFVGCMGSKELGGVRGTLAVLAAFLEEERSAAGEADGTGKGG